jgi:hypothetical protein
VRRHRRDDTLAGGVESEDGAAAARPVALHVAGHAQQHAVQVDTAGQRLEGQAALALQPLGAAAGADVAADQPGRQAARRQQQGDQGGHGAVAEAAVALRRPGHVDVDLERAAIAAVGSQRHVGGADDGALAGQLLLRHPGDDLVPFDDGAQGLRVDGAAEVARPVGQRHQPVGPDHLVVAHAAGGIGELEDALVLATHQPRIQDLVEAAQPRLQEFGPVHRRPGRRRLQQVAFDFADGGQAGRQGHHHDQDDGDHQAQVAVEGAQTGPATPERGREPAPAAGAAGSARESDHAFSRKPCTMSGVT